MVGEIISLINLYLNRQDKYGEKKRENFQEHIKPIYSEFQSMHTYYLQAFQKYRDLINSSTEELSLHHKIFDEIWKDYLFSEAERASLRNSSNTFSQGADDSIFMFFDEIYNYLTGLESSFHTTTGGDALYPSSISNVAFSQFDAKLRKISKDAELRKILKEGMYDKRAAITALDKIVMDLQNRAVKISNHYSQIRKGVFN